MKSSISLGIGDHFFAKPVTSGMNSIASCSRFPMRSFFDFSVPSGVMKLRRIYDTRKEKKAYDLLREIHFVDGSWIRVKMLMERMRFT